MLALKRLILSWDPLLILSRKYELGFQDAFASGGYRAAYIGRWGELEPSDQTDFDL
jgi:hypothetical protein